jgi:peptidoglycan-N-acetylglucosamine deacetylase
MKTRPRQLFKRFMNFTSILLLLIHLLACDTKLQTTAETGTNTPTPQYLPIDSTAIKDSLRAMAEKKALEKLPKSNIDSNSKVLYFTFDDGPLSATPHLTQIVNEKQIKLTEFAVGKHAQSNKQFKAHLEAMKRNPAIEVHNHSYSHANSRYKQFYSAPATAAKDIMDNEDIIGTNTKIVRMPGRDIWATPNIRRGWSQSGGKTAAILLENGFRIYGWDMEWEHYGSTLPKRSPEQIVAQIDDMFRRGAMQTPNHLVFLAHDEMLTKEKGREDLRLMIDMLKQRGYVFEFISHYPL